MNDTKVRITDKFWGRYRKLVREEMLPYQWNVLNDKIAITIERERDDDSIPNEKSHAIENFRIAAGQKPGNHYGWVFQDSDVYKWLEATAYTLREKEDKELQSLADSVVDLISEAQEADGYLDTYFTIEAPDRKYKCLAESHELYCAGHYLEAAAAYYKTTGNRKVLETACKLADHIDSVFGKEEGKIHGYDGHEEIEIGLMHLYRATGNKRYLELSRYFLLERGCNPDFFADQRKEEQGKPPLIPGMEKRSLSYYQAHKPVLEQDTAEGHAVRLVYLCTAMADVATATGDEKLLEACRRLWRNIIDKRLYITGGVGSTVYGEAFTLDYDLPNDTMYCETCASVGLIFFAYRMLAAEDRGEYGDIMERALYNTVLGGMALDGKHFFYVNPLEANPGKSKNDPGKSHVKCVRPQWLGCACCPPNLARLLASLEQYVYIRKKGKILVNLFMNCQADFQTEHGSVTIVQKTGYPWTGEVQLQVEGSCDVPITIGIRIPGWSDTVVTELNGRRIEAEPVKGFIYLEKVSPSDVITVNFDMEVKRWYANVRVSSDTGKTAVSRGPILYCMEEADNGTYLNRLSLERNEPIYYGYDADLLGGAGFLTAEGWELTVGEDEGALYRRVCSEKEKRRKKIKWIPYYSWANRGENEMQVWIREEATGS